WIAELAKHMPSAGSFYTYVSNSIHPGLGFLVGWAFELACSSAAPSWPPRSGSSSREHSTQSSAHRKPVVDLDGSGHDPGLHARLPRDPGIDPGRSGAGSLRGPGDPGARHHANSQSRKP